MKKRAWTLEKLRKKILLFGEREREREREREGRKRRDQTKSGVEIIETKSDLV